MEILEEIEIDLNKGKLLKEPPFSKWTGTQKSRKRIESLIEDLLDKYSSNIKPQAIYDIIDREKTDLENFSLPRPILDAKYLAFSTVTIGKQDREKEGRNSLESLITDALENIVLNKATREVVRKIKENTRDGLKMTRLFSPGSGRINWGIENQELIFENLDAERIGVSLKSGCVIDPPKSISFLIGLGENIKQPDDPFSCQGCERTDCPYRSV